MPNGGINKQESTDKASLSFLRVLHSGGGAFGFKEKYMLTSKKVSESIRLGSILMFSGGFLDAYSYLVRGQVFATAETGNIALMGISLARGDLAVAGRYLIPVAAYAAGIFLTDPVAGASGDGPGRIHAPEVEFSGELSDRFFLRHAGRSVPEDARHGLCHYHVYRKFKKRDRASGRGDS